MSVLLWSRTDPYRCACDGAYRPQLNARGKLVKSKEPAWRMMEQTRARDCLQELVRGLAKAYALRYQHHKTSKGSGGGYPDVHMWAPQWPGRGDVYIELKRMGQDPTDIQVQIMAELQDAHPAGQVRVYLARPCCLLAGAVDELMADFAGLPCRYIEGDRSGPVFPIPAADPPAGMPRHTRQPCPVEPVTEPAPPSRGRPLFRLPPPPGRDPGDFPDATGLVVGHPDGAAAHDAMRELEQWLREAGFSPVDVPYPIRLVVGDGRLHAQCRRGLARPGADARIWREGRPARPFPLHLAIALRAAVTTGETSAIVEARIAEARPGAEQLT